MNKNAPTMDEVWHTLPLGMPRCHTGTHRHRVVFDCVALHNVLCRHAPPLRWRETAVVFILCWHTLPLYWLAHSAIVLCLACIANESCDSCRAGATTSPLIIILCSQHTAFLLFCVGTHCQRVMRLMPCGGYDKSSYYYFVFSTHRFFIILCWHALPTSHATHAVRGLRQVLLLLFCVLNTPLFIICVGTLCQRVMRLMPCGGYDKSSYYYFVFSTHCFLLFVLARFANESCDSCRAGATTSPLIIICVCNTPLFIIYKFSYYYFVFATHRFFIISSIPACQECDSAGFPL